MPRIITISPTPTGALPEFPVSETDPDYGGRVDEQARYYFDRAAQVILRPDIVWQSGTEIRCHAIDLSLEPDQLLGQVRDLAGTIAAAQGEAHLTPRGSSQ